MTSKETKEYMAKAEVHQLFEGMLTGLLYNKPDDPLTFLEDCISRAKQDKNIKWDTFLDVKKSPLPPIPQNNGPIKTESGEKSCLFSTEVEENFKIKQQEPLPPIGGISNPPSPVNSDKDLMEKNIITSESDVEEDAVFAGQRIVFVLGGPGSGKGTQCGRIVETFGYAHLSAGDLLRREVTKGGERGGMIENIIKEGKLVPQEITIELLKDAMELHPEAPGFLIDGFPRDVSQGLQFEKEVVESDLVLFFECNEEIMEKRLLKRGETSGRTDDNLESIKKRFQTYLEKTMPVIEHYDRLGKVKKVDANRDIDDVFADIKAFFESLPSKEIGNAKRKKTNKMAMEEAECIEEWETFSGQRIVFVLGGPGCGKGTQCDRISDKFGLVHLSTGDLLRAEVESGSERGKSLAEIMKDGKLVPMETVIELLRDAMLKYPDATGFLIDGFPRERQQGVRFESEIVKCHFVLYFECNEEVMEQRLLKRGQTSGRTDDNAETIKKRFQTYLEKTMPVIEHFEMLNKVKKVDANRDIEEVFQDVCKIFGELPKLERTYKRIESSDEFADAVEDLENVISGKPITRHKKKNKVDDNPYANCFPANEEPIIAEEFVPLGNQSLAKTDGKGLLNARVIFVIGGPGSGKGTQCARIVDKFQYTHLSTGDLLRAEVESGSERGKQLVAVMERGELVSNEWVLELLRKEMIRKPNTKGFLIDGFPRELEQGKEFEREIAHVEFVLYFDCSEERMKERLMIRAESSGRADDNLGTILKRLQVFSEQTVPVIDYFKEQDKVKTIVAEGTIDEVFEEVNKIFENLPDRKSTSLHNFDVIFVVGGPGSGKTELSKLLAESLRRAHISVGQLLREEAEKDTERGQDVATAINSGTLVDQDHVLAVLMEKLFSEDKNLQGYVVDGYPRTEEQINKFTEKISDYKTVIFLECSEEEMQKRVTQRAQATGRKDDKEDILKTRIEVYRNNTSSLADKLVQINKATKLSASQTLQEVFEEAKEFLLKEAN